MLAHGDLAEVILGDRHPDIVTNLRQLAASLAPPTQAELDEARDDVHRSAAVLDEFLNEWKSGEGWRKYLRLSELLEQTAAGQDESSQTNGQTLATLLSKFENTDLDATYRVAFEKPAFQAAAGALRRYVSLLGPADAERHQRLLGQVQSLLASIEAMKNDDGEDHASAIRETADALAASAVPEEAALGAALRKSFVGPNVHVEISASLLEKFVGAPRSEEGPVREWLGGARIVGTQTTQTTPRFELDPSENGGSFSLLLSGTSRSTTTAYKSPARIYGGSYSEFGARKQVWVTADGLQARPAKVNVYKTHNSINGADVDVGFLFAGIARSTAIEKANAKRPEAEALAERRVRERVTKRLDAEIDAAVARVNDRWDRTLAPILHAAGLNPKYVASRSTSEALTIEAELLYPRQLAADGEAPSLPEGALAAVNLHESAVNNALDQMQLAGTTVEAQHMRAQLREALAGLLDPASLDSGDDETVQGSITFAEQAPLRVHFRDGQMQIVLRAAQFKNGEVKVPGKTVLASYELALRDGQLALARNDELEIRSAESDSAVVTASFPGLLAAKEAAVNAALRMRLAAMFRESMEMPASFTVTKADGEEVPLAITHVDARDGWLTIGIR